MTIIDFSKRKSIAILLSFLTTFVASRLIVFLIDRNIASPFLGYNIIDGRHIHHYAYGIIILSIVGFIALFIPDRYEKTWIYLLYGFGLGLIYDEFGIWLNLDPTYNQIISYFAVVVTSLLLVISGLVEHRYRKKHANKGNII
jgi:hypothetical protein